MLDWFTNCVQTVYVETCVVLNGQYSSSVDIQAWVPQGFILGPLLFLIYVNGLPNGLGSECKLFADDTSLFSVALDVDASVSNTKWLKANKQLGFPVENDF